MRIWQYTLPVVLLLSLSACEDDSAVGDDDLADAGVVSTDAALLDEIDAAVVIVADAGPDAAPWDPDASPPDASPPDASPPDAIPAVSFALEVKPILLARCGGCHLKATGGAGGMSLGTQAELAYAAMVGQDTVNANPACADLMRVDATSADPMKSSLYVKIVGATCGNRMPVGSNPTPLDETQVELIGRWIAEGAQNN